MSRLPAPHWPSIRGRARADIGPLLLSATVVALVALLAGTVPALLRAAADDAVQGAVGDAHGYADVTATARWESDHTANGRIRDPHLARALDAFRSQAQQELGTLRTVLGPPVATATSPTLTVAAEGPRRTLRLAYLTDGAGPDVTWIAGAEPGPAFPDRPDTAEAGNGVTWPVRIGLSETVAAALGAGPGDRIPLIDEHGMPKHVHVSGIFRAADPGGVLWRPAPWLLNPMPGSDGPDTLRMGGLLSPASLPDARLAFNPDQLPRTVWFTPDPRALTWQSAQTVTSNLVALKAESASTSEFDTSISWNTQFDAVLRGVRAQLDGATMQASVLLTGVLAAAVLVLLLVADVLVRRRAGALTLARQRGAALPALGAELLIESAVVAAAAAATGLVIADALVASVAWQWAMPAALIATAATPVVGMRAAVRATRDQRTPANRSARRRAAHTTALRRAVLEAAVVVAAVGAFTAMHQPGGAATGGVLLPASAPTLGVLAGALLLLRLLPPATAALLAHALRSRRPLAVFGAARAAATARQALPLLALVTSAAMAAFALTVHTTVSAGAVGGAWQTVGADARLDVTDDARQSTPQLVQRLAAEPGVRHAVAAQVTDNLQVTTGDVSIPVRLVIVDSQAFQRLLADTPLPAEPALTQLTAPTSGNLAALVRSTDGTLRPGMTLSLFRGGDSYVTLTSVGAAPPIGDAADIVLLDATAAAAAGIPAEPNMVWVTGPAAERAVTAHAAAGVTVLRTEVLRSRTDAPLTAWLLRLAWACAAALVVLGLLGLALAAAAQAPARRQTLARLRALGLRPRDVRPVAAGELLPLVLLAATAGPALGVAVAAVTLGPLALRLLTGQVTDPVVGPHWPGLVLVAAVYVGAVAVMAPTEWALGRSRPLGEVLRAGDG